MTFPIDEDTPFQIGNSRHMAKLQDMLNLGTVGPMVLFDAANPTDTSITLRSKPYSVPNNTLYAVIGLGTVNCEIRKATTIVGAEVNLNVALTKSHSVGDIVHFVSQPVANVVWFGAKGDDTTDDSTAIQRAIDQVELLSGGEVLFPDVGPYRIDNGITVSEGHVILRALKLDTRIKYYGVGGTALTFEKNAGGTAIYRNGIFNLTVYHSVGSSAWGDGAVGVHIHGCKQLKTEWFSIYGFHIGLDIASTTQGCSYNDFGLSYMEANEISIRHIADGASAWATVNTFRGGSFVDDGGINTGTAHFQLQSINGAVLSEVIRFIGCSFEGLFTDAINLNGAKDFSAISCHFEMDGGGNAANISSTNYASFVNCALDPETVVLGSGGITHIDFVNCSGKADFEMWGNANNIKWVSKTDPTNMKCELVFVYDSIKTTYFKTGAADVVPLAIRYNGRLYLQPDASEKIVAGGTTINGANPLALFSINGGQSWKRNTSSSDYTAQVTDTIVAITDTSSPRTVYLPNVTAVGAGFILIVKDESGGAGSNNILVSAFGTQTIDGALNYTINTDYGVLRVYCDGSNWFTW